MLVAELEGQVTESSSDGEEGMGGCVTDCLQFGLGKHGKVKGEDAEALGVEDKIFRIFNEVVPESGVFGFEEFVLFSFS